MTGRGARCAMAVRYAALGLLLAFAANGALAADVIRGADLYRTHCAHCHGAQGRPVMPMAPDFTRLDPLMQPDPRLLQSIRNGRGAMPGYQGLLRDRDILDVIAHLRTLPMRTP